VPEQDATNVAGRGLHAAVPQLRELTFDDIAELVAVGGAAVRPLFAVRTAYEYRVDD
jgi:hypothetical protein